MGLLVSLEQMAPSPQMQQVLRELLESGSKRVKSKAAIILGRKFPSPQTLGVLLKGASAQRDPRYRANVIESLWHVPNPSNEAVFRSALSDPHHRVVANALLGLYFLLQSDAAQLIREMARHESVEYRVASAYAMGETGHPQFLPDLGILVQNEACRSAAIRAVMRIQKARFASPKD